MCCASPPRVSLQERQDEESVARLRAFASQYATTVAAAASAHYGTVSTMAEMATDISLLGPAVNLLSQVRRYCTYYVSCQSSLRCDGRLGYSTRHIWELPL